MAKLNRRAAISGVALTILGVTPALARASEIYMDKKTVFKAGWNYALGGADVVAYFGLKEGDKPIAGRDQFSTEYNGVQWRFSSKQNLDVFVAASAQYAPQFGGYCAWAMARNKLARGAPEVWHIYKGKLYMNVSKRYKREWLEHIDRDIARGEVNWPSILDRN